MHGKVRKFSANGGQQTSRNPAVSPLWCLRGKTGVFHGARHEDGSLHGCWGSSNRRIQGSNEANYPKYDNYDAINVDKTQDIPMDYCGFMGVPITFLHKFNPQQFELVKFRKGDDDNDLSINGKCPYFRIIIKNRKPVTLQ